MMKYNLIYISLVLGWFSISTTMEIDNNNSCSSESENLLTDEEYETDSDKGLETDLALKMTSYNLRQNYSYENESEPQEQPLIRTKKTKNIKKYKSSSSESSDEEGEAYKEKIQSMTQKLHDYQKRGRRAEKRKLKYCLDPREEENQKDLVEWRNQMEERAELVQQVKSDIERTSESTSTQNVTTPPTVTPQPERPNSFTDYLKVGGLLGVMVLMLFAGDSEMDYNLFH